MDRGEGGEVEPPPDFLEARSIPVLLDELLEEIENFPLTFRNGSMRAL